MANRLKQQKQSRRIRQVMVASVAVFAAAFLGLFGYQWMIGGNRDGEVAGVTHREVQANAVKYVKNELPNDLHQRITRHIDHCGPCRKYVDKTRQDLKAGKLTKTHRSATALAAQ